MILENIGYNSSMTLENIARFQEETLENIVHSPEIILLIGARQVGKSTLMRRLEIKLQEQGEKTVFLNLDIEADAKYFESQEKLIAKIELECGSKNRAFV
ncbi:MAG: AAA family ATPase, partial [Candidatus Caenarcaniphilales bacterium]|nr:AAA family ATPase [Candidatus Caenarcaniphilales bacterium]